jgi:hypothetical protein
MCSICISEQVPIISTHSNNRLFSMTETQRVYCAVRFESLNMLQSMSLKLFSAAHTKCFKSSGKMAYGKQECKYH